MTLPLVATAAFAAGSRERMADIRPSTCCGSPTSSSCCTRLRPRAARLGSAGCPLLGRSLLVKAHANSFHSTPSVAVSSTLTLLLRFDRSTKLAHPSCWGTCSHHQHNSKP